MAQQADGSLAGPGVPRGAQSAQWQQDTCNCAIAQAMADANGSLLRAYCNSRCNRRNELAAQSAQGTRGAIGAMSSRRNRRNELALQQAQ